MLDSVPPASSAVPDVPNSASCDSAVGAGDGRGDVVRVRLDISYDGTDFAGWAVQPDQRTVAGEIVAGLARVTRATAPVQLVVAGRTDAGVHATGQVAHVDLPVSAWLAMPGRSHRTPGEALVTRMLGVLPPDVVVLRAGLAAPGFDARFSAVSRSYAYRICDAADGRNPLRRNDTLWLRKGTLDVAAMHEAAGRLVGEFDWLPYCKPRDGATTVRTLLSFSWSRDSDGVAVGRVSADAFCHHMVRSLVGASIDVGLGRRDVGWPERILLAGVRDSAVQIVQPHGLTLVRVAYPDDSQLAQQARLTRRVRTLPPVVSPGSPGLEAGQLPDAAH